MLLLKKVINFNDDSHGFEHDGHNEVFVIDAEGKFIKNKTVKGKTIKELQISLRLLLRNTSRS